MVVKRYIPEARDVVWVDLEPAKGHEQAKIRPALVISPRSYNEKTGLAIMCPITSVVKGYPFEVSVSAKKVTGAILADHVRSLDWKARNARFISKVPAKTLREVQEKLSLLISS